jgi:hypothetical protein
MRHEMRVTCNANTGKALTTKALIGYTPDSIFHVAIGQEYPVFGVAVYRGATLLLLSDDNDLPNWYPVDLFTISEAKVSKDWYSASYQGSGEALQFLMGYERLVTDEGHYDGILERFPADLEVFRMATGKTKS